MAEPQGQNLVELDEDLTSVATPAPEEPQQESPEQAGENDASELIKQLGKQQEAPTTDEPQEQSQEEEQPSEKDFSKFEEDFEKYFGVKPQDAFSTVKQLQEYVAQSEVTRQKQMLATDWGVDMSEVDARIPKLQEYLKTLPQEQQAALDNVEGAKLIWSYLQRKSASPTAPQSIRGRKSSLTNQSSAGTQPRYKMSELQKLPESEYKKHSVEINNAFMEGRVEMDVDNLGF